jgi:SAM-dependent methyltransferase
MSSSDLPDYVQANVAHWTKTNTDYTDERAPEAWAQEEITWGIWKTPESELRVLPPLDGIDVVELGCGTAYFSAWLAKHGARPVGVDPTPAQLDTARRMQRETGIEFPLVEAPAEDVPLPDASFDLVLSEYGASIWADPFRWIPEAARLARPGGRLVFLRNSTLVMLCMTMERAEEQLVRPQRDLNRLEWPDTGEVEFHLPHGPLVDLLRANDLDIERLIELFAPADATTHEYYAYVSGEWGQRWPAEELWSARKRA